MIMIMIHFLSVLTYTLSTRAYYPYYVLSVWGLRAGIIIPLADQNALDKETKRPPAVLRLVARRR